jgi:hypothetical protein
LKAMYYPQTFSLCSSLLPGCYEVNNIPFHHDFSASPCTGPEAMEPSDHGLKPLKAQAKINPSSPKLFSQVFCHTGQNLTKITFKLDVFPHKSQHVTPPLGVSLTSHHCRIQPIVLLMASHSSPVSCLPTFHTSITWVSLLQTLGAYTTHSLCLECLFSRVHLG